MSSNLRLPAMKSFYSHQHGGLITLDDDVLGIVSQVKQEYDNRVSVQMDPDTNWYLFIEHCEDGTDRLIFTVERLDGEDVMDRLRRSDSTSRAYQDPYDAAEREQDELMQARDDEMREQLMIHGEQMAYALKKEGRAPHLPAQVFIPRSVDA